MVSWNDLNYLNNDLLSNNNLDKHLIETKSLKALNALLPLKEIRIAANDGATLNLDIVSLYSNENENIDLICNVTRKYLLVCHDPRNELVTILNYIKLKQENGQIDLKLLRIMFEILHYCDTNNLFNIIKTEDYEFIKHFILTFNKGNMGSAFLNTYFIPTYIKLIQGEPNYLLSFFNNLMIDCMANQNLNVVCNIFNYISDKYFILFFVDNMSHLRLCLNSDKHYVQKQAIYILRKCHSVDKTQLWQNYFTLIELSKEKQLHLIQPSLKFLRQIIKEISFEWQYCLFKILLNHSQISVVYITAWEILESTEILTWDPHEFIQIMDLLLNSINKNEFSETSNKTFQKFSKLINRLSPDKIILFFDSLVKIFWSPIALWSLLKNIFVSVKCLPIPISVFSSILRIIQDLPHLYIREACKKVFIKYYLKTYEPIDFEDYIKVLNMLPDNKIWELKFKEQFTDDIIQILNPKNIPNLTSFVKILQVIKQLNLNYIHNIQVCFKDYPLDYQLEILNKFLYKCHANNDQFTTELLLDKYTEFFDKATISDANAFINAVNILDPDKTSNLNAKFYKVLKSPNTHNTQQNYISFHLIVNNQNIIHIWQNNIKNPLMKIDNVVCNAFIDYYFKYFNPNHSEIFDTLEQIIENQTEDVIVNIYKHLKLFVNACDYVNTIKLLDMFYQQLPKLKKIKGFKEAVSNYIDFLLSIIDHKQIYFDPVYNKICSLVKQDDLSSIFSYNFANMGCNKINSVTHSFYLRCIPIIIDIILKDISVQKESRIEYAVCQEIMGLFGENSNMSHYNKVTARVAAINMMRKLIFDSQEVADIFGEKLMDIYMLNFNKRYFPDSQIHLQKLRIMQCLLVLCPHIASQKQGLIDLIMESFSIEINQPCVKQLMQWIIILLTKDQEKQTVALIKTKIDSTSKTQPSAVVAFVPVLLHLTFRMPEDFWHQIVEVLLPYCMGAHFKLRVYSQMAIKTILEKAVNHKFKNFIEKYSFLSKSIEDVMTASGQSFFDTLKADKYLFDTFDPDTWYNLQTIFMDIPRHNKVIPMEWENFLTDEHRRILDYQNKDKSVMQSMIETNHSQSNTLVLETETGSNIQRKITPWKDGLVLDTSNQRQFILISSLIDKSTNLGGLSRTCEVFGVQKLVLNDRKIINDKEFKSLSMSSENWLNVTEVKINDLKDFILSLKDLDYTVIGAEQTAESVVLDKYKFPQKTALLLGNEKEGIPANLIPLLDVCVEIPQFGLIRSLNVHVAGATFIWEYTKQHLT